jgi:hypothetical protein
VTSISKTLVTSTGQMAQNPPHHRHETSWVLEGTSIPNPLSKIINIYSDYERSESSHDTSVLFQEEKSIEKTSSLEPEVQTKEVPQKEIEFKSGLETKGPNTSHIKEDLKDKPELEEPKKESLQKKINGSPANEQVSNNSIPNVFILPNNQIPDE